MGLFILSVPSFFIKNQDMLRLDAETSNLLPPTVSKAGKVRPGSIKKLASELQGVSDMGLKTTFHILSLSVWARKRKKNQSL